MSKVQDEEVVLDISIREARSRLRAVLERVLAGEEVILRRRGEEIARLVPPPGKGRHLPSLSSFRDSIVIRGESIRAVLEKERTEERT